MIWKSGRRGPVAVAVDNYIPLLLTFLELSIIIKFGAKRETSIHDGVVPDGCDRTLCRGNRLCGVTITVLQLAAR